MRKLMLLVAVTFLMTACAEQRFIASIYADRILHPHNPKVLVFSGDMRTGQITDISWHRMCDVADCTMHTPEAGAGIVHPAPQACYTRWWKECDHKNCRAGWWERCTKQEEAKAKKAAEKGN